MTRRGSYSRASVAKAMLSRPNAARMAMASPCCRWFAAFPRRNGASSIDGRSSRMRDEAWTSSITAATGTARAASPPQISTDKEREHRAHVLRRRVDGVGHGPAAQRHHLQGSAASVRASTRCWYSKKNAGVRFIARRAFAEDEQVLIAEDRWRRQSRRRPAASASRMIAIGIDAFLQRWARVHNHRA